MTEQQNTPQPPVRWDLRSDEEKTAFISKHDPQFAKHQRELGQFLDRLDGPQRITVEQFDYYAPLFSRKAQETMSWDELMTINRAFWRDIDQYRPIIVTATDPETGKTLDLFTLPRLFTQFAVDGRRIDPFQYSAALANMKRQGDRVAQSDGRSVVGDIIEAQHADRENIKRVALIVAETKHVQNFINQIREGQSSLNIDGHAGTTASAASTGGDDSGEIPMTFYED